MPELPEIETVKNVIEPQIKGLEIKRVTINRPEIIERPTAEKFSEQVTGQTITEMSRRGKFLTIHLNSGDRIILHLRMTGCLLFTPIDYPEEKHTHVVFHFENSELRFSDTRRFGRFWLINKYENDTYSGIHKLGLEPFDKNFNAEYLKKSFSKRKKAIKECLLDQSIVAGIGNIYSDEILFRAKINPTVPANILTQTDCKKLAEIIPKCLAYFIEKNKISAAAYLKTKGRDYRNTPFLQVYGKEGEPCPICGVTLCRTVIDGRSSVYCKKCQGDFYAKCK